ncbi:MAG TPA: response regulator, partial [Spirochaetes bacterium]|nr:response regulator [Spirochaetota bacterium]
MADAKQLRGLAKLNEEIRLLRIENERLLLENDYYKAEEQKEQLFTHQPSRMAKAYAEQTLIESEYNISHRPKRIANLRVGLEKSNIENEGLRQEMIQLKIANQSLAKANVKAAQLMMDIEIKSEEIESAMGELVEANQKLQDTQNRLIKSEKDALASSQAKSMFLANMSHELRTPLNAIIGYSEMLAEDAEEEGLEEMMSDLQKIQSAGKHLLGLINDVLDISKVEAGKMELNEEKCDILHLVEEIVATVHPLVERNSNILELDCAIDINCMYADVTKVRQVLYNLLSNACKFTERGRILVKVKQEIVSRKTWVIFSVSDTGIGMSSEEINNIFYAFTQADTSTIRKYGGTGLGLTISRYFCQLMGGDLNVKSEMDQGSIFTARFPLVQCDDETTTRSQAPKVLTDQTGQEKPVKTILVIDDDSEMRDMMKRHLTKNGFDVQVAQSGKKGLEMAQFLKPDLITLDILMPSMGGWSVLTSLKGDPETVDIPVVVITVSDGQKTAHTLGASGFLVKPVDHNKLIDMLNKFIHDHSSGSILVVEDNTTLRQILHHHLTREGWNVIMVKNGREAIDKLKSVNKLALILLDLIMPEMDGFQLIEELQNHDQWQSIPVVVLTEKNLTSEDNQRLDGHVNKIFRKSTYSEDDLLNVVHNLIHSQ